MDILIQHYYSVFFSIWLLMLGFMFMHIILSLIFRLFSFKYTKHKKIFFKTDL